VTEDEGSQVPVACDSTGDHEPHQHEGGWCLGMPVLVPWNDEAPLTDEQAREFRERLEESLPGRQVPIDVLLPSGTVYFAATPRPGAVPLGPADDVRITVSDTRGNTYDVTGWDTPPAPGPVSALPAELARHLIAGVVRRHAEDPADPRLETMIDELAGAVTAMPGTGLAQGPGEAAYPLLKTTITQGGWDEKDRERFREQLEEHLPGAALRRTDGHYHSGQMHASHGSLAHPGWLAHDGHPLHRHSADGRTEWQPEQAPDQAQQQPGPAAVRPQHPASAFPRPDQASQWPDGTTEVNQRVDGSWDVLDPAGWRWAGWWAGDAWTDQQPIQPPDLRQQQPDQGAAAVYYPEPVPQQPGWPAAEVPWEPEQPADQAPEHPYQVVMIMLARIENELLRMTQALAPLIALAAEAQAADAALAASQLAQPSAAQQRAAQIAAEHGWTAGPAFAQQAPGGPQAAPAAPPDFYGGHVVAPPDFAAIAEASDGREDES